MSRRARSRTRSSVFFEGRVETLETRAMLSADPIWSLDEATDFDGQTDFVVAPDSPAWDLGSGSVALSFEVNDLHARQTLFAKDGFGQGAAGEINASVANNRVEVKIEGAGETVRLFSGRVGVGEMRDLVVTWGDDGFRLFVDGRLLDAAVDADLGLSGNQNEFVVGASNGFQSGQTRNLDARLEGTIEGLAVYDRQLDYLEVAALAGLETERPTTPRMIDGVLTGTDSGERLVGTNVEGGYGDDLILGAATPSRLDGGYGEDIVRGGPSDDLLISRSDAGEPPIQQAYGPGFDPLGEIDPVTRTTSGFGLLAADDILIGGDGADTFRFEVLMNAKERILFSRARADGSINWSDVAQANTWAHDHWVESLGDDAIADFDRSEGDRIVVAGHTADVYSITHHDTNGDGFLDATLLKVRANQGPEGAHTRDHVGTITVYGDLVTARDIHRHSHSHGGVIANVGDLPALQALRPDTRAVTPGETRWSNPNPSVGPAAAGQVFAIGQPLDLRSEQRDFVELPHTPELDLPAGSVALSFQTTTLGGRQTLFAKNHADVEGGAHVDASISRGRVEVRVETDAGVTWLLSRHGSVVAGREQHVALTWRGGSFELYLDGERVDHAVIDANGLIGNPHPLLFGASNSNRRVSQRETHAFFDGVLDHVEVYSSRLDARAIAQLADEATSPDTPPPRDRYRPTTRPGVPAQLASERPGG